MADLTLTDATQISAGNTVVATWGSATANSYVTLAAAESYITAKLCEYTAWSGASQGQKEAALIMATQDIDSKHYIYHKYSTTQMLEFPRSINRTSTVDDWTSLNLTTLESRMQEDVKAACCHQAVYLLEQNDLRIHTELQNVGVSGMSRKVGPITEEYQYGEGEGTLSGDTKNKKDPFCKQARTLLADWLDQPRIVRG